MEAPLKLCFLRVSQIVNSVIFRIQTQLYLIPKFLLLSLSSETLGAIFFQDFKTNAFGFVSFTTIESFCVYNFES